MTGVGLFVLAAWGWWIASRRDFDVVAIWSALYFLLVVSWAWPPPRFLVPLTPLFLYNTSGLR
ncbi:MAG: hypothetical protein ABI165_20785 [Bryobacteraceae bacterium]